MILCCGFRLRPYLRAYAVTRRVWLELASWRRGTKGWGLARTACWPVGFRVLTPLLNLAVAIDWRRDVPAEVLREATQAVEDRETKYGPCEEHFARTAALVSAFLGHTITGRQWAMCMVLDKVARSVETPDYRDNYVDIAGYADRAHRCALADVASEPLDCQDHPEHCHVGRCHER